MDDQKTLEARPIALQEFQAAAPSTEAKAGILERCFALLEAVAASPEPPTIGDLIEKLALPRATVYRLVEWFLDEGFLARGPMRKGCALIIGHRFSGLALNALRAAAAMAPPHTLLEMLVQETGEACHIGTLDCNRVIYLDRVESATWPPRLHLPAGSRAPLHATATGKLFLALSPSCQRRALLAALDLIPLTPATITDRDRLEQQLESIRHQGFALDDQEFLAGAVAIAVPITNRRGEIRAGLAVHAPEARMTAAAIDQHLLRLRQAAERLARTFFGDFSDIPVAAPP